MDLKILKSVLEIGETIAVEFKRCGNGIESDTYESVCSFLNRFGGDIFLGYWMTELFAVSRKMQLRI
ncbi:hypothetical protein JCM17039_18860 [Blautia glucerasea]